MFGKLLLLFVVIPMIDMAVLLAISRLTHWSFTLLIILASGLLGAWLAKRQWYSIGFKIRDRLVKDEVPADLLTDGTLILFAAGLLITPGIMTDLIGLSLLVPQFRTWYKRWALHWLKIHLQVKGAKMQSPKFDSGVVDGEVVSRVSRPKSNSEQQRASA
jgi:UPF0716 protein FxsA